MGAPRGGAFTGVGRFLMGGEFDFVESPLPAGLSVIEASAGTGKTYAISHLLPRLLLEGDVTHIGEILLVTFTRDAARELSERVRRVFEKLAAPPLDDEAGFAPGVHRLRTKFPAERVARVAAQALLDLDRLQVSTIHSFCQRTLQTDGALCGLPVVPELILDANELIDEVLYDLWERTIAADAVAAAVAAELKWSLVQDLDFIRKALPLEHPVAVPPAEDFARNLRALDTLAGQFTAGVCDELDAGWRQVEKWNQKAPSAEVRAELLATLEHASGAAAPGFLAAVLLLADSLGWIAKSRKQEAIRAAVEGSAALALARSAGEMLARLRWDFRNETLAVVRRDVAALLRRNRQITYDGLVDVLAAALRGPQRLTLAESLRRRYRVALIDESQDTDARQFEIFRAVFVGFADEAPLSRHRLVLIGDPKQAIYAFRGADVNTYLGARRDAGEKIFHLTRTYRAPQPLVEAINALFRREGALLKDGLEFAEGSSGVAGDLQLVVEGKVSAHRLEAWCVPDVEAESYSNARKRETQIANVVASEIVRTLNSRAELVATEGGMEKRRLVEPGDIAVLVNTHREAEAVAEALRLRDVPAIRAGDDDVMASEEAREILVLLRALQEPRRTGFRLAALATRLLGRTSADLAAMNGDTATEDEMLRRFVEWQDHWHRAGIAAALAQIDQDEGVIVRLAPLARGERRVTNFRQVVDLLQRAAAELGRRPGHLVRWLAGEVARATGRSGVEERQQQLESDADAVQIVTMHAAKGLEYALVFCPFLWGGKRPSGVQRLSRAGEPLRMVDVELCRGNAVVDEIERAALEDRLRLAYVAMTRARAKVWVLSGEVCGTRMRPPPSSLDWLLKTGDASYSPAWRDLVDSAGRGGRHGEGWALLAERSRGVIAWGPPPAPTDARWDAPSNGLSTVLCADDVPKIPAAWRMTSFSALTREKSVHGDASPIPSARAEAKGAPGFARLPGGTELGTAVHDWIEGWDFSPPNEERVGEHLRAYALPGGEAVGAAVTDMLRTLREVRLPGLDCTVAEACPDERASEWHFQLPIGVSLSSEKLAAVFACHGEPDYAAILALLPVEELAGYLHGFLDRIACHNGTWGVIDWKTNNLGTGAGDYAPESLAAAARQSHYLLQTHLYLVALRRFLGPNVPIAGAWLVYLRGIQAGTSAGVLTVQPSAELMTALDALFAPPMANVSS